MFDFARGDATGLQVPAHVDALRSAGPAFLTEAFHAFGSLERDNAVTAIRAIEPCSGGSTGAKYFLHLDFARSLEDFDGRLFCKFSRDFADERRDWQKTEMESEARMVALSREPGFPVRVPKGWFADFEAETGTGIVITECVPFGIPPIEPHRRKTLDHETMADPLPYYLATTSSLAALAGRHKSGQLRIDVDRLFPWAPETGSSDPIGYDAASLDAELDRCLAFAREAPQLFTPEIRDEAFLTRLREDAQFIREHETELRAHLEGDRDLIALNHWNSHIDNAWFWREDGALHCGLIDWGRAGQLTFGATLWGGLSAAHHDIWDHHLDTVLANVVQEYARHGGPEIEATRLARHLDLHMAVMGVARVLAFPEIIRFRLPECVTASGPRDPMFRDVDPARNCLHVYTVLLKRWQRRDFGRMVRELVASAG